MVLQNNPNNEVRSNIVALRQTQQQCRKHKEEAERKKTRTHSPKHNEKVNKEQEKQYTKHRNHKTKEQKSSAAPLLLTRRNAHVENTTDQLFTG